MILPRPLIRAVSLVLAPCLLLDPAFSAINSPGQNPRHNHAIFSEQAFVSPLIEMLRPLSRTFHQARAWQSRGALHWASQKGVLYLNAGPDADSEALELAKRYYSVKDALWDAFVTSQGEAYHQSYRELQKVEEDLIRFLEFSNGREKMLHAVQVVQDLPEFKTRHGAHSGHELIHTAGLPLTPRQDHLVEESAAWITRLTIDLPSRREAARKQLVESTVSISLSRLIPANISGAEPSKEDISGFKSALGIPAAIEPLKIAAMVTARRDPPYPLALLTNPEMEPVMFRPVFRHETIHFLAALGFLPISSSNELVTSMVDGIDLYRTAGARAARASGEGVQAALFDRGRAWFNEGGSIADLAVLGPVVIKAFEEYRKTLPSRQTESEVRQSQAAYDEQSEHMTIDPTSTIERFIGYFAAGYLWERRLTLDGRAHAARFWWWPGAAYRAETRIIDQNKLDEDVFAYMRRVVALDMRRSVTPTDIANARQALADMTQTVRSILRDPTLQLVPWQSLYTGDEPQWRYLVDQKDGRSLHQLQFVPDDMITRDERTRQGFAFLQIFKAFYSFRILPDVLRNDTHLWSLWNALEPMRVVPSGLERWKGVTASIQRMFDDRFALVDDSVGQRQFADLPVFLQFIDAAVYQAWSKSEKDPRVTDSRITEALSATHEARIRMAAAATPNDALIILQNDIYPHLKPLVLAAENDAAMQRLFEQQVADSVAASLANGASSLDDLDDDTRQQIEQEMQKQLDAMSRQEREAFMRGVQRGLQQAEKEYAKQTGNGQMADGMSSLTEKPGGTLPKPGHESHAAPSNSGGTTPTSAREFSRQAEELGRQAGQMANDLRDMGQDVRQAEQAASQTESHAGSLQESAGTPESSANSRDLAESASRLERGLERLSQQARDLEAEGEKLEQAGQSLESKVNGKAENVGSEASDLATQASALRAKTEHALQHEAKPLEDLAAQIAQDIAQKEEGAETRHVRDQANAAKEHAERLRKQLESLAQKAVEAQKSAERLSGHAQQLDKNSEVNQPESLVNLIRPVPLPPEHTEKSDPPPVPRAAATAPVSTLHMPSAEARRRAEAELAKRMEEFRAEREPLTEEQLSTIHQYLEPVSGIIILMRAFIRDAFQRVQAAIQERHHRHGRLDRRSLVQAVVEDQPRAYQRRGPNTIPQIRWSLLVDISGSMLNRSNGESARHGQLTHRSIADTRLEYASQAAAVFAESLHEPIGEPLPGHESEIVAFTDMTVLRETGGWVILKKFKDRWSKRKLVEVLDSLLSLGHQGTKDYTAIHATLERGRETYTDEHIVVVLTDGDSEEQLEDRIEGLRKDNPQARVIGIGIGPDARAVADTYKPYGFAVRNIRQLPQTVREVIQREMQRVLTNWETGKRSSSTLSMLLPWIVAIAGATLGIAAIALWHPSLLHASAIAGAAQAIVPLVWIARPWSKKASEAFKAFRESDSASDAEDLSKFYDLMSFGLGGTRFMGKGGPRVPKVKVYGLAQNFEDLRKMEATARRVDNRNIYLWGPHGTGKNYKIDLFAAIRNQGRTLISAHEDMTVDDIFERQVLRPAPGSTAAMPLRETRWELNDFAHAMMRGEIGVWDEYNRMPDKVKAALNDALQRRSFTRKDGTVVKFHDDALVVATSNPPDDKSGATYTTGEQVSRFNNIEVQYLGADEEAELLMEVAPGVPEDVIKSLVAVAGDIRAAKRTTSGSVVTPLSTRELVMLVQHFQYFPSDLKHVGHVFKQAYLPGDDQPEVETLVERLLLNHGFADEAYPDLQPTDWEIVTRDVGGASQKYLRIGDVEAPLRAGTSHIPERHLKEAQKQPQNLRYLQDLLKAVVLKQHILLEGEAGVGKDWALDILFNAMEYPVYIEPINENTTADDIMGWYELKGSLQEWQDSKLEKAVKANAIYYLSEINRCKPGTMAAIYNFMENGFVQLANQETLDARDKDRFLVVASANPNRRPYSAYPMPGALRSRFKKIRMESLPEKEEVGMLAGDYPQVAVEVVKRLVKGANVLRKAHKQGTGTIPYQVGVRLLQQVLESLTIDPYNYEDEGAIEVFLDAYGAISQGSDLADVVKTEIQRALKNSDVKLHQVHDYRPVQVGNPGIDAALRKIQSSAKVGSWSGVQHGLRQIPRDGDIAEIVKGELGRLVGLLPRAALVAPINDWLNPRPVTPAANSRLSSPSAAIGDPAALTVNNLPLSQVANEDLPARLIRDYGEPTQENLERLLNDLFGSQFNAFQISRKGSEGPVKINWANLFIAGIELPDTSSSPIDQLSSLLANFEDDQSQKGDSRSYSAVDALDALINEWQYREIVEVIRAASDSHTISAYESAEDLLENTADLVSERIYDESEKVEKQDIRPGDILAFTDGHGRIVIALENESNRPLRVESSNGKESVSNRDIKSVIRRLGHVGQGLVSSLMSSTSATSPIAVTPNALADYVANMERAHREVTWRESKYTIGSAKKSPGVRSHQNGISMDWRFKGGGSPGLKLGIDVGKTSRMVRYRFYEDGRLAFAGPVDTLRQYSVKAVPFVWAEENLADQRFTLVMSDEAMEAIHGKDEFVMPDLSTEKFRAVSKSHWMREQAALDHPSPFYMEVMKAATQSSLDAITPAEAFINIQRSFEKLPMSSHLINSSTIVKYTKHDTNHLGIDFRTDTNTVIGVNSRHLAIKIFAPNSDEYDSIEVSSKGRLDIRLKSGERYVAEDKAPFVWMEGNRDAKTYTFVLKDKSIDEMSQQLQYIRSLHLVIQAEDGSYFRFIGVTDWIAEQEKSKNPSSFYLERMKRIATPVAVAPPTVQVEQLWPQELPPSPVPLVETLIPVIDEVSSLLVDTLGLSDIESVLIVDTSDANPRDIQDITITRELKDGVVHYTSVALNQLLFAPTAAPREFVLNAIAQALEAQDAPEGVTASGKTIQELAAIFRAAVGAKDSSVPVVRKKRRTKPPVNASIKSMPATTNVPLPLHRLAEVRARIEKDYEVLPFPIVVPPNPGPNHLWRKISSNQGGVIVSRVTDQGVVSGLNIEVATGSGKEIVGVIVGGRPGYIMTHDATVAADELSYEEPDEHAYVSLFADQSSKHLTLILSDGFMRAAARTDLKYTALDGSTLRVIARSEYMKQAASQSEQSSSSTPGSLSAEEQRALILKMLKPFQIPGNVEFELGSHYIKGNGIEIELFLKVLGAKRLKIMVDPNDLSHLLSHIANQLEMRRKNQPMVTSLVKSLRQAANGSMTSVQTSPAQAAVGVEVITANSPREFIKRSKSIWEYKEDPDLEDISYVTNGDLVVSISRGSPNWEIHLGGHNRIYGDNHTFAGKFANPSFVTSGTGTLHFPRLAWDYSDANDPILNIILVGEMQNAFKNCPVGIWRTPQGKQWRLVHKELWDKEQKARAKQANRASALPATRPSAAPGFMDWVSNELGVPVSYVAAVTPAVRLIRGGPSLFVERILVSNTISSDATALGKIESAILKDKAAAAQFKRSLPALKEAGDLLKRGEKLASSPSAQAGSTDPTVIPKPEWQDFVYWLAGLFDLNNAAVLQLQSAFRNPGKNIWVDAALTIDGTIVDSRIFVHTDQPVEVLSYAVRQMKRQRDIGQRYLDILERKLDEMKHPSSESQERASIAEYLEDVLGIPVLPLESGHSIVASPHFDSIGNIDRLYVSENNILEHVIHFISNTPRAKKRFGHKLKELERELYRRQKSLPAHAAPAAGAADPNIVLRNWKELVHWLAGTFQISDITADQLKRALRRGGHLTRIHYDSFIHPHTEKDIGGEFTLYSNDPSEVLKILSKMFFGTIGGGPFRMLIDQKIGEYENPTEESKWRREIINYLSKTLRLPVMFVPRGPSKTAIHFHKNANTRKIDRIDIGESFDSPENVLTAILGVIDKRNNDIWTQMSHLRSALEQKRASLRAPTVTSTKPNIVLRDWKELVHWLGGTFNISDEDYGILSSGLAPGAIVSVRSMTLNHERQGEQRVVFSLSSGDPKTFLENVVDGWDDRWQKISHRDTLLRKLEEIRAPTSSSIWQRKMMDWFAKETGIPLMFVSRHDFGVRLHRDPSTNLCDRIDVADDVLSSSSALAKVIAGISQDARIKKQFESVLPILQKEMKNMSGRTRIAPSLASVPIVPLVTTLLVGCFTYSLWQLGGLHALLPHLLLASAPLAWVPRTRTPSAVPSRLFSQAA